MQKNSAALCLLLLTIASSAAAAQGSAPQTGVTSNSERVAEIAVIDKRTGQQRIFSGKPGDSFSFGNLTVGVKTCETTPPWETKLSGAFLQIDEKRRNAARRIFSGWMFAESPSLNPLENPRYDVWVKSCAMRWPEKAPGTVVVGSGNRSSVEKSASTTSASASSQR